MRWNSITMSHQIINNPLSNLSIRGLTFSVKR